VKIERILSKKKTKTKLNNTDLKKKSKEFFLKKKERNKTQKNDL